MRGKKGYDHICTSEKNHIVVWERNYREWTSFNSQEVTVVGARARAVSRECCQANWESRIQREEFSFNQQQKKACMRPKLSLSSPLSYAGSWKATGHVSHFYSQRTGKFSRL